MRSAGTGRISRQERDLARALATLAKVLALCAIIVACKLA
jgi:hypothetical protein